MAKQWAGVGRSVSRLTGIGLLSLMMVACGGGGSSGGGTAQTAALSVQLASWDSGEGRLVIRGRAGPGDAVSASNAVTGAYLGRDTADGEGRWQMKLDGSDGVPCRVRVSRAPQDDDEEHEEEVGHHDGEDEEQERDVDHAPANCQGDPIAFSSAVRVLAANDLGMHCADLDYQVFSILPPFNVVHAQVIQRGNASQSPRILSGADVDVVYSAVSSPTDPAGAGSINTTSRNAPGVYKSNFWASLGGGSTLGARAYAPLYPSVLALNPGDACAASFDCPSSLSLFEPLPQDLGLPVPDPNALFPETGAPALVIGQQAMPGRLNPYLANDPQHFDRFDEDLAFFVDFPFGSRVREVNWFAADGVPILPVDDSGRVNAYPLMKVRALSKGGSAADPDQVLASLDVVLPVASEADCQNCHVSPLDCVDDRLPADLQSDSCNGAAVSPTEYTGTSFPVADIDTAPGETIEQRLLNAAKLNILRLHDARHGSAYRQWSGGALVAAACNAADAADADCLANQTPVQCSQCHYSPALDLAQAGPVDEPEQGPRGRQQRNHISMSRAMHYHHGEFTELFPDMPPPRDGSGTLRHAGSAEAVLTETCYQCHPGKRTQCLRGAMFAGGVVCQDCHGDMRQVGNDFTAAFPDTAFPAGADLSKRVPWASEPKCQSCHIGDALTLATLDTSDFVLAADGIRLLQAYRISDANEAHLPLIEAPDSRFAEDQSLYRLSKGHGGVMCEGCHGSTHAIWPVKNPAANDNLAPTQLQGHSGTVIECVSCHGSQDLGLTLGGPHGMHPVGDADWNEEHEEVAEDNKNRCRACHGTKGEGTVLSRMAQTRTLRCEDDAPACGADERIVLTKGAEVGCGTCHENKLD